MEACRGAARGRRDQRGVALQASPSLQRPGQRPSRNPTTVIIRNPTPSRRSAPLILARMGRTRPGPEDGVSRTTPRPMTAPEDRAWTLAFRRLARFGHESPSLRWDEDPAKRTPVVKEHRDTPETFENASTTRRNYVDIARCVSKTSRTFDGRPGTPEGLLERRRSDNVESRRSASECVEVRHRASLRRITSPTSKL